MIVLICSHLSYFFLWAVRHATPVHKYPHSAGKCWDSSPSLKCAQQLCLICNNHWAFFIWNNIPRALAIVFSLQLNTRHHVLRHQSANENFILKVRFSLILSCLSSIWSMAIDSYSGGSRPSLQHATLYVESAYCRRRNAFLDYIMKTHRRVIQPSWHSGISR